MLLNVRTVVWQFFQWLAIVISVFICKTIIIEIMRVVRRGRRSKNRNQNKMEKNCEEEKRKGKDKVFFFNEVIRDLGRRKK